MAKNKKRSVSTTPAVAREGNGTSTARTVSRSGAAEFNPDYSYVKKDLVRIGILAGSFFIVLVVLSFFLR